MKKHRIHDTPCGHDLKFSTLSVFGLAEYLETSKLDNCVVYKDDFGYWVYVKNGETK